MRLTSTKLTPLQCIDYFTLLKKPQNKWKYISVGVPDSG